MTTIKELTADLSKVKEVNSQLEFNAMARLKAEIGAKDDAYAELLNST